MRERTLTRAEWLRLEIDLNEQFMDRHAHHEGDPVYEVQAARFARENDAHRAELAEIEGVAEDPQPAKDKP
jgi:hypothetical protein